MAKQTGLQQNLIIGGTDVSGDVGSIDETSSARATQDTTGIDKAAYERLMLLADGKLDFSAYFNPTGIHPVLAALPTSDVLCSWLVDVRPGGAAFTITGKQVSYDPSRPDDGSLALKTSIVGSDGYPPHWGVLLTDGRETFTTADTTGSHDLGAAQLGALFTVHLTAFTGTDVTVSFEASSDDGAGDAFALIDPAATHTFTAAGAVSIRLADTVNVEQFVRANITGTFTSAELTIIAP